MTQRTETTTTNTVMTIIMMTILQTKREESMEKGRGPGQSKANDGECDDKAGVMKEDTDKLRGN